MADLSVMVFGRAQALSQIQAPAGGNLARTVDAETLHLVDTLTPPVRIESVLTQTIDSEALHLSDTAGALRQNAGDVIFQASPDHASVTDYTARLRVSGSPTVVDTLSLGVPTPGVFNNIVADLSVLYSGQAAGDYTVSILTTTATGSADSEESNAFTLPLA